MHLSRRLSLLAVAGAAFFWGTSHPASKVLLLHISPFQLALARGLAPGIGLALLLLLWGRFGQIGVEMRTRPLTVLGMGMLAFFGFLILTSSGLRYLPASVNSLLVNTSPLMIAIWLIAMHRRLPSRRILLGLLFGFIGVAALSLRGMEDFGAVGALGVLLSTGASAAWAIYTAWGRRESQTGDAIALTAASSLAAIVPFFLVGLVTGELTPPDYLSGQDLLLLAYVSIMGGALPYALWSVGLKGLSSASASAFLYVIPLTAVTLAVITLGEPVTLALVIGGIAILGGVFLAQTPPPRSSRPADVQSRIRVTPHNEHSSEASPGG